MKYWTPQEDAHNGWHGVGVLLTNHGSPDAPTRKAVRRYLANFLSDQRLIEFPRLLWLPILHGIILNTRPGRVAKAYQKIWTDDGAPLTHLTASLAEQVEAQLQESVGPRIAVRHGMTYGKPGIESALQSLREWGARRILVMPLYPQYSATTVGSVFDKVTQAMSAWRWLPELRFVTGYEADSRYIQALATSVRRHWNENGRGDRLLFSFHGIPQKYFDSGDPYPCFCHRTARLTAEALGLADDEWSVSFQSRFGPTEWIQPYTDDVVKTLAEQGHKTIDAICPGFAVDCLETVEEIADELAKEAKERGCDLRYVPCLNDTAEHADAIAALVSQHLGDSWERALQPAAGVPAVRTAEPEAPTKRLA